MKSIKELITSPWRGSERTYQMVQDQLRERYGDEVADEFDASVDAMPLISWAAYGYRVRKGEKALKSITYVEIKNEKDEVIKKIKRTVNLFHRRQVQKAI